MEKIVKHFLMSDKKNYVEEISTYKTASGSEFKKLTGKLIVDEIFVTDKNIIYFNGSFLNGSTFIDLKYEFLDITILQKKGIVRTERFYNNVQKLIESIVKKIKK